MLEDSKGQPPQQGAAGGSPYMTIEELAVYLRHSPHAIRYWHKKRILPPPFKPGGKLLWHRDEIDRWMNDTRDNKVARRVHHRMRSGV